MEDIDECARQPRRGRKKSDVQRIALLDAAEVLMREEGYAAVTSRRVARQAGVGHQLVHYYFRNMDELYLAVFRRGAVENLARLRAALTSDKPLRALWMFMQEPGGTGFTTEFTALASHSEAVREEIVRYGEEFRRIEIDALTRHFEMRELTPRISPIVISVLLVGISAILAREASLGFDLGHSEVEALVEEALRHIETATPPCTG